VWESKYNWDQRDIYRVHITAWLSINIAGGWAREWALWLYTSTPANVLFYKPHVTVYFNINNSFIGHAIIHNLL
jgi:hypothetical protein